MQKARTTKKDTPKAESAADSGRKTFIPTTNVDQDVTLRTRQMFGDALGGFARDEFGADRIPEIMSAVLEGCSEQDREAAKKVMRGMLGRLYSGAQSIYAAINKL